MVTQVEIARVAAQGPSAERTQVMIAMRKAGHTLESIGQEFGLTRERVRQLTGAVSSEESKNQLFRNRSAERQRVVLNILEALKQKPDLTVTQLVEGTGTSRSFVLGVLRQHELFALDPDKPAKVAVKEFSTSDLVRAVRQAVVDLGKTNTISGPEYEAWRLQNPSSPSKVTLIQRYDTWNSMLITLGLTPTLTPKTQRRSDGTPVRIPDGVLLQAVMDYLIHAKSNSSAQGYVIWARETGRPSLGSVRNRLGGWNETVQRAKEEVLAQRRSAQT